MMAPGTPNVDQLMVLLAVVKAGTFAFMRRSTLTALGPGLQIALPIDDAAADLQIGRPRAIGAILCQGAWRPRPH